VGGERKKTGPGGWTGLVREKIEKKKIYFKDEKTKKGSLPGRHGNWADRWNKMA